MRNSIKFVKIRDLMIEIEALRQLADDKADPQEVETLRKQLIEADDKLAALVKNKTEADRDKFDMEREHWEAER